VEAWFHNGTFIVVWFSKQQPAVESSVFGAEFVAMKNVIETTCALHYKLMVMGAPLDGPTYVYGDNMYVVHNTQHPESVLKKKIHSICNMLCTGQLRLGGPSLIGHVPSVENPAGICTKIVPGGQKRNHLSGLLLIDLRD
jgi:hypothetical protein